MLQQCVTESKRTVYRTPNTTELPIPETYERDRPQQTEYETEILVIGGGYAGMNAAYTAKELGRDVLLIDKGRPGYSGQSPWPGTFNYFDPERGDDRERFREFCRYSGEYFADLDWIDIWMNESKAMKERIESWGMLDVYPRMCETKYWATRDYYGYRDNVVGEHERRPKFVQVLNRMHIPWLQHVMMTNIIVDGGRCVGAMGFQFTTGAVITVHAKAVILAAGNGCIIPTGHPIGDNSFDGEYMAYRLGLPIGGKEFEDFHPHHSFASGSNWLGSDSRYFDPNFQCGGTVRADGKGDFSLQRAKDKCEANAPRTGKNADGLPYLDTAAYPMIQNESPRAGSPLYGIDPAEKRIGKLISPNVRTDAPGAAVGMCLHLASGVFCGMDDTDGRTEIPGLWVAGDGCHLTNPGGGNYGMGNGFTSCFVSICGDHAGKSASAYCEHTPMGRISDKKRAEAVAEIEQPLHLERGFSPNWARDVLQGIMAPYWVSLYKSEETLRSALTQVLYMKEHVAEHLLARTPHDLRLCHEMKHKINASELKLRASLERTESRGNNFYREDYPQRDDANWLKYILQRRGPDGTPEMSFVPVKPEWTRAGIPGAQGQTEEA